MLSKFTAEQAQFLEVETREFSRMDRAYLSGQEARAMANKPLQTFKDFYEEQGYKGAQITALREALSNGVEIMVLTNPKLKPSQIRAVTEMALARINPKEWINPEISARKIKAATEIGKANSEAYKRIDATFDEKYLEFLIGVASNPELCEILYEKDIGLDRAKVIWKGIKCGVWPANVAIDPNHTTKELEEELCAVRVCQLPEKWKALGRDACIALINAQDNGFDVTPYMSYGFSAADVRTLAKGLENGVNMDVVSNPSYDTASRRLLCEDMAYGRDTSLYEQTNIDIRIRKALRDALIAGNDSDLTLKTLYPNDAQRVVFVQKFQILEEALTEHHRKEALAKVRPASISEDFVDEEQDTENIANEVRTENVQPKIRHSETEVPPLSAFDQSIQQSVSMESQSQPVSKDNTSCSPAEEAMAAISNGLKTVLGVKRLQIDEQKERMLDERAGIKPTNSSSGTSVQRRLNRYHALASHGPDYPEDNFELYSLIQDEVIFFVGLGKGYNWLAALCAVMSARLNYYSLLQLTEETDFVKACLRLLTLDYNEQESVK